jgi:hypothetical protein
LKDPAISGSAADDFADTYPDRFGTERRDRDLPGCRGEELGCRQHPCADQLLYGADTDAQAQRCLVDADL